MFTISELTSYYEEARFMELNIRNPMIKGLKFSRTISQLTEEINAKNQTLARASQIKVMKTTKLRKLI